MDPANRRSSSGSPSHADLSIIIVSWNVCDLLRRCLDSLLGSDDLFVGERSEAGTWQAEVIVVDNASDDQTVEVLHRDYLWVRVVANMENRGFTRANNQGLEASSGRYVLFLNPDTEVAPSTIGRLLHYAETHPEVGIIGPQLRYGDGSIQSSRRRFPSLSTYFLESTILQRWWPRNKVLQRYYMLDRPDDAISQVDWIVGACMLVRRQVLDAIGGFDEGFFMYSEELDLCRRAVDAGWQVVYFPEAVLTHYEGKSSEQIAAARNIHFYSSRVRYVQKYHGSGAAALVRGFLLGTFAFQWSEEAAKCLVGRFVPGQRAKLPMRRERMAAYARVLRSGLRPVPVKGT
ncbi:MAG: glycosyltransferase family 2 protein [Chloroflexota bacterium]|nr:glycosyltransferase family 2 protein [Chloroflexota bacterium]